jgi:PmbA protein
MSINLSTIFLEDLMNRAYKYLSDNGAEDIAIKGLRTYRVILRFYNNSLATVKSYDDSVMHIYVGANKRRTLTAINVIEEEKITEQLNKVLRSIGELPEYNDYTPLPDKAVDYKEPLGIFDSKSLDINKAVDKLEASINSALDNKVKRVAGTLVLSGVKTVLKTSGGRNGEFKKTIISFNMRGFKEKDISYQMSAISTKLDAIPFKKIGEELGLALSNLNNVKIITPGKYNVIISPIVSANLLGWHMRFASAYTVDTGISPFTGKLDEKVVSDKLTLIDDPTMKGNPAATPFDDEGTPTVKTVVVENGVLKTYLHNTTTAKKYNVESTGHAGIIAPSAHSLIVGKGDFSSLEELAKEVSNGILITNVWYTRFQNYRLGEFSTLQRDIGIYIENGEFKSGFKGARLSDNIINIFQRTRGLTKKRYWIKWWDTPFPSYTPYIAIENVNITTGF